MGAFENRMGITKITYKDELVCHCPIGKSFYTNNLVVTFIPTTVIPDYIEVHQEILIMDRESMTIESAVAFVFDVFNKYELKGLRVESRVDDARHPEVIVVKDYSI